MKRKKTASKRVKTLTKRVASAQARNVRGGYIGETEKNRGLAKKGAI